MGSKGQWIGVLVFARAFTVLMIVAHWWSWEDRIEPKPPLHCRLWLYLGDAAGGMFIGMGVVFPWHSLLRAPLLFVVGPLVAVLIYTGVMYRRTKPKGDPEPPSLSERYTA